MRNLVNFTCSVVILLSFLFAGSCKVSSDAANPNAALPAAYRQVPGADTASVAAIPMEVFFSNAELQSLLAEALAHNNDLQVAVKNIGLSRLTLRQAKLGNVPSFDFLLTAGSSRPSDNSLNGLSLSQYTGSKHVEDYTAAASLSWEADIWGKIRSQKASALAAYLQTQEARDLLQTQLINDVSKGFYNLLMLDEQQNIAEHNVLLDDSTLKIIQLQYQSGQVTSLAVQQAEAQRLTAAGLVSRFEELISIQENALSILVGKMPGKVVRNGGLESVQFSGMLSAGIPSQLLSRRPDVRFSELSLSKANAEVGYAKASMYPSLTITAQGGLDALKASNWFNIPASLFGLVTGGLAQPLFDHQKLSTQYEIAKVNREKTVLQFRQAVLNAVGEVSDALVKIDKLKEQQLLATDKTATLLRATKNAQLLFNNGLANYLEVITAQGNVLQSELELASIKKDRLDAMVDLYRSVGGGTGQH